MMSRNRPHSLVSISFEGGQITAVLAHRRGTSCHVRRAIHMPLSLDPLKDDPRLVAQEIRNLLAEGGIRARRCVVLFPLNWAFLVRADVPALAEDDSRSFLNTRVEREIPVSPADLIVSVAGEDRPLGGRKVTLAAVPRTRVSALVGVLRAARLHVVRMTFGVSSLTGPDEKTRGRDGMVLLLRHGGFDLAVFHRGDLVSLRALDSESEMTQRRGIPDPGIVENEIRFTLGELPEGFAEAVREVRVFGPEEPARNLVDGLSKTLQDTCLAFDVGDPVAGIAFAASASMENARAIAPATLAVAGKSLLGYTVPFDFSPAQIGLLHRARGKVSSRKTRWAVSASLAMVLFLGGLFAFQYGRLSRLEELWLSIQPDVEELEALQERVRRFEDWYSDSHENLELFRALSEAFPEEGILWARNLHLRGDPDGRSRIQVSCNCYSRSRDAWLNLLKRLRGTDGIGDLRFKQLRGETPMEFEMEFHWTRGGGNEG